MASQTTTFKKPVRPLTAYHLFFLLEREFIIQNIKSSDEDSGEVDDRPLGKDLDATMPRRYQQIHLSPLWYASASGKRTRTKESDIKRKHRKSHGKISFQELSRLVALRWSTLEETDKETKMFCAKIAKIELQSYKEKVKIYKAHVAASEQRSSVNSSMKSNELASSFNSAASSSSSVISPEIASILHPQSPSIYSQTGSIGSPGKISAMSGSSSFELSSEFLPTWMKKSKLNVTGSTFDEAETSSQHKQDNDKITMPAAPSTKKRSKDADFSFIPLPPNLQEQEDSFLKSCQNRAISSNLHKFMTMPYTESDDDRTDSASAVNDVIFDSTMRELDTRISYAIKSERNEIGLMKCKDLGAKKRCSSDISISPVQCYGNSLVQCEYKFTSDDAEMLLKALF
jgi:hypothetical protein